MQGLCVLGLMARSMVVKAALGRMQEAGGMMQGLSLLGLMARNMLLKAALGRVQEVGETMEKQGNKEESIPFYEEVRPSAPTRPDSLPACIQRLDDVEIIVCLHS
jgi:hypothetical protein